MKNVRQITILIILFGGATAYTTAAQQVRSVTKAFANATTQTATFTAPLAAKTGFIATLSTAANLLTEKTSFLVNNWYGAKYNWHIAAISALATLAKAIYVYKNFPVLVTQRANEGPGYPDQAPIIDQKATLIKSCKGAFTTGICTLACLITTAHLVHGIQAIHPLISPTIIAAIHGHPHGLSFLKTIGIGLVIDSIRSKYYYAHFFNHPNHHGDAPAFFVLPVCWLIYYPWLYGVSQMLR